MRLNGEELCWLRSLLLSFRHGADSDDTLGRLSYPPFCFLATK